MIKKQNFRLLGILFLSSFFTCQLFGMRSGSGKKGKQKLYVAEQALVNQDVNPESVIKSKEHVNEWLAHDAQREKGVEKNSSYDEFEPLGASEIFRESRRSGSFSVPLSGTVTPVLPGAIPEDEATIDERKNFLLELKLLRDEVDILKKTANESSFAGLESVSQRGPSLTDQIAHLSNQLSEATSQFKIQQKIITDLQKKLDKIYSEEELLAKLSLSEKASVESVSEQKKVSFKKEPVKKTISFWKRFSCCCGSCDDVKNGESSGTGKSKSSYDDQESSWTSDRPKSFDPNDQ